MHACSQSNESLTIDISKISHNKDSVLTIFRNINDSDYIQILFYPDWQIHELMEYKNGTLNGKYFRWRKNGRLSIEGYKINGEYNRVIREVYENGRTFFEGERVNGEFDGINNRFYESGAIKVRWTRKNGKDLGEVIHYYENGLIKEIGENTLTGYIKTNSWDEKGQLIVND